ncbi:MAG: hypothetical protein JWP33_1342 [Blastococcus sp.]|nr:hypothetical protein [Blastococcus sp.]
MKRRLLVACTVLVPLVLAACGSDGNGSTPSDDGGSASADDGGGGGLSGTAMCRDARGDGGTADLTMVELAGSGDGLTATFTMTAPMPGSGPVLLSLAVSSGDGETARQLGARWVDGQATEVYVFDVGEAQNEDVNTEPSVDGGTVRVTFPSDAVSDLGATWRWRSTTSVGGVDVDACPEASGDMMNVATQPFPG